LESKAFLVGKGKEKKFVGTVEGLVLKGFKNSMADYLEETAVGASVRNLVYDFLGERRGRVGEEG
jgi:hypothetical protein